MEIKFAKHRNIPIFYFNGETLSGETATEPPNELEDTSLIWNFYNLYYNSNT